MNFDSLKNSLVLSLVAATALSVGCVRRQNTQPAAMDETPVPTDQAMERRVWAPSTALYSSTAVYANNTGFLWQPDPKIPLWALGFADTGVFFANVVVMPFSLIVDPPGKQIEYRAETYPPTSNGNPPWPPPPQAPQAEVPQPAAPEETSATPSYG